MLDDLLDAISIQYEMGNFLDPLRFVSESSIRGFNEATLFFLVFFGMEKITVRFHGTPLVLWLMFVQILS